MPETKTTIYQALLKAQQDMGPVLKNATNPAFKSKYADLGSVIETITKPLHDNGLVFYQRLDVLDGHPVLITKIRLVEGDDDQQITSLCPVVSKDAQDPQKFGGAVTYMRRYSLLSLLGLAPEDDDGNSASQPAAVATGSHRASFSEPVFTPAGAKPAPTTQNTSSARTYEEDEVVDCQYPGCEDMQTGSFANTCKAKFGKVYCRRHWGMAKNGELPEPGTETVEDTDAELNALFQTGVNK